MKRNNAEFSGLYVATLLTPLAAIIDTHQLKSTTAYLCFCHLNGLWGATTNLTILLVMKNE